MSTERDILQYLKEHKHTLKYKGVRVGFLGLPNFSHHKYQTLANECSSLQKRGFVKKINEEYFITMKGEEFLENGKDPLKKFSSAFTKDTPKDLLVIYDISEEKKREREWFRFQLRKFHFIMIQRSVWVGPSPLPKEFLIYLKQIKINESFKTFRLAKGYEISK